MVASVDVQIRQMVRAMGSADVTIYNGTRTTVREFILRPAGTLNESLVTSIKGFSRVFDISPELVANGQVNKT